MTVWSRSVRDIGRDEVVKLHFYQGKKSVMSWFLGVREGNSEPWVEYPGSKAQQLLSIVPTHQDPTR